MPNDDQQAETTDVDEGTVEHPDASTDRPAPEIVADPDLLTTDKFTEGPRRRRNW